MLQSWKLSSIETRSWCTTELIDYRAPWCFGSHPLYSASPMANSALSMLAGILARTSVWLLQFLVQTGRRPVSLFQTFRERLRCSLACLYLRLLVASAFLPLLAVWEWPWTPQRAETWWHSRVASSREPGDSIAGRSFCRKSLGSVPVWLRRLAHFREKLQSPCKNFLRNAQIENTLEGQTLEFKKKKKDKDYFF